MPGPTFDVLVVGSANLDVVVHAARHPEPGETLLGHDLAEHPGGKGLNQAVASARSGARTAFVGALGRDGAGDRLHAVLDADRIDATHVTIVDDPTGRALIVVADDGENTIVVAPGANATVRCPTPLPSATVVLAQLELPLDTVVDAFRAARAAGSTTVLNPAPATALPPELLGLADIVVPNEHEAELLGGPERLLTGGSRAIVVTRGGAGVDIHTADGVTHVAAHPVVPVDTTGAGDAFCGSLCARLAAGDQLADAVDWATVAGALATTVRGAVPAQPTAAAIRTALNR